ncbi:preprotein translocase subunit SecG [Vibrio sp.]|nr:preprotein translocase subunit SecG [Vibrio sp.]
MFDILLVIYLLAAIGVIGLVLIQQGKGADMGASFGAGAGASNTVFGAGGSGNFLTKMTTIFAIVFFGISLALGNMSTKDDASKFDGDALIEDVQQESQGGATKTTTEDEIPQ